MTADIVAFTGLTKADHKPEQILQAAIDADLSTVVVVGREMDGSFWFSGNKSDAYEVLWLLELAKRNLLAGEP